MVTVYSFFCTKTGRNYIGSTKNLSKRYREHRGHLRRGTHAEPELQRDWQAYGPDAFGIRALETLPDDCSVAVKRDAELKWMRSYETAGFLYNSRLIAYQGPPGSLEKAIEASRHVPGRRWTPEANLKRSLAQKGKPKGHGAKISATKKRLGQRPTPEAASMGGSAACAKKWAHRSDEIV